MVVVSASCHDAVAAARRKYDARKSTSTFLNPQIPEDFATGVDTVSALVRKLHYELHVPLSFIEHRTDEPISLPAEALSLEDLLQAVVDRYSHYRCVAVNGRLILRSTDPTYDLTISGVEVKEQDRMLAVQVYLRHLNAFDQRFEHWNFLLATAGGVSPVFVGRVTLSPEAPMIQHLVQLLGKNEAVYFGVPAADPSGASFQTIDLRVVSWPFERMPPLRRDLVPSPP